MASNQESKRILASNKISRRKLLTLGAGGALGLGIAAACGEGKDLISEQGRDNTGVEHGYFTLNGNFENVGVDEELVEEDLRLKDYFERTFNKFSAELLGNEVGIRSYGGSVIDSGHSVVCKVKNGDNSVSIVRFISRYKSKLGFIELEQQIPGQEPTVQTVYNETQLQTASELIDRLYPLRWIYENSNDEPKVLYNEWDEFEQKVWAIADQATEDKKTQALAISEEEKAAAAEIVGKYDSYSQEAIDLKFKNLDGYGRPWNFDQVSQYLSLYLRNDEKQQLIFSNFYLYRVPEVVGVTNPTTRTIWLNDGSFSGTVFIGQDRTAWWYDHPEKGVWTPLTVPELEKVSHAMTEIFERAKLKQSL